MLFLALLPSLALASPFKKHSSDCFSIVQFGDSGVPHSLTSDISFNVSAPAKGAYPALASTQCRATQNVSPSVATSVYPMNCTDTTVQFWLQGARSGYYLTIARELGDEKVDFGTAYLGNDVETRTGITPTGDVQYLNHTPTFDIPYTRFV